MDNPQIGPRYIPNQQGELPGASTVSAVPVGSVLPMAMGVVPQGYLLCDGTSYNANDYSDLFGTIGVAFNDVSDASGSFRVPDLRARFPVGAGGSANFPFFSAYDTIGSKGGATRVDLSANQLPVHNHIQRVGDYPTIPPVGNPFLTPAKVQATTSDFTSSEIYVNGVAVGAQQPLSLVQPYLTLYYVIKY